MTVLRDPVEVARLGAQQRDENWRFAAYLRMIGARGPARIEHLAEQVGRAAEAQMDCTECGACCRDNCVPVSNEEVAHMASRAALPVLAFRHRYVTRDDDGEPAIDAKPCPFLHGNACAIYADRPEACRGYPYLGGSFLDRISGMIERAEVCPIVFEMMSRLKEITGFSRMASGSAGR